MILACNCTQFSLTQPTVVAVATDKFITAATAFMDPVVVPGISRIPFGQDATSGTGRAAPDKQSVGTTIADLKPKMEKLVDIFASGDNSKMAKRLFDMFLAKQTVVKFYEDALLNRAAAQHENIRNFCDLALSAPNSPRKATGKVRIHQALKNAGWDISKIVIPTDLGVPAFNLGSKIFKTGDFNNGLGVMVDGVQHAFVVATSYCYDSANSKYCLTLKYVFYDVFGLDDVDLKSFGASSDSMLNPDAAIGITAWWQLQHQFGFVPLLTRIIVERSFEVSTK
jgi:hypothetical protein